MSESNKKLAMRVSFNTIIANILLSIGKLFAGLFGKSSAMISDAIHSASDVFSTLVVIAGVSLSSKSSDKEHPYGHERIESIAAFMLGMILFMTGAGIGFGGIKTILSSSDQVIPPPNLLALGAAIISILVKEIMYWYTRHTALKIKSSALMADAWHHRSDAFSSVGSLIGILGARLGFPIMGAIASVIICLFILKVSIDILIQSINQLIDKSCDDSTQQAIITTILQQEGVISIDSIKTRMFGSKIYLDLEIVVNHSLSLIDAHNIAEVVHSTIESSYPNIKHCMVHVNPSKE